MNFLSKKFEQKTVNLLEISINPDFDVKLNILGHIFLKNQKKAK
jgi:hypothetical protein